MKSKKAAMEMSVGTIVTIVLLMSVLILGIVLIQKIFSGATGVIDMTEDQIKEEVRELFGDDRKVTIYPSTRIIEIKQEDIDAVGLVIKNLVNGDVFSYEVSVSDAENCEVEKSEVESWIVVGKSADDIAIASGDISVRKIRFQPPSGSPLCTARFSVSVDVDGETYASDFFDITVKAK